MRFFQEAKEPIKTLWETSPLQMCLFTKLRKIVRYYKQLCLARLRKHLELWQVVYHFDITNGTAKARVKLLRD